MVDDPVVDADSTLPLRQAIGAYLKALREHAGLSLRRAGALLGTSDRQVFRAEQAETDIGLSMLLRLMILVEGSFDDLFVLQALAAPTAADGIALAQARIALRRQAAGAPPSDRLGRLLWEIARTAQDDPALIDALHGYLAGRRSR